MRHFLFLAIAAFAGFAAHAEALFIIRKNSGFVLPENRYALVCDVTSTGTSWQKAFGADSQQKSLWKKLVFTRKVKNKAEIKKLVEVAASGRLVKAIGPTDGPTSQYSGILEGEVVTRHVKIYMDFSSTKLLNSAATAREALVEFANANCPLDFEE